jgi:hypothetical protein
MKMFSKRLSTEKVVGCGNISGAKIDGKELNT